MKDQRGLLTIEALAWLAIFLVLLIAGGAVVNSILTNRANNSVNTFSQSTLFCPDDSVAMDIRRFIPDGLPIIDANGDGFADNTSYITIPSSGGKQMIAGSPYIDLDGDTPLTAEIVCIYSPGGY